MEEEKKEVPFPMAPIVRVMKQNLDSDKIIRGKVKEGMNKWLGEMCTRITKEMNKKPYTSVDYSMFKDAIQIYDDLKEVEKEKERIIATLEKIKQDCDSLIRDLNRKLLS